MPDWLFLAAQFCILAFAALGGLFLAFSDFIMRALKAAGPAAGACSMQEINKEVFRYVFMPLFLGMVPVSIFLSVAAWLTMDESAPFLATAVIYVLGVFGVTVVQNVPMNNRLAKLDLGSEEGVDYWSTTYLPKWTLWNTVRTIACFLASAVLLFSLSKPLTA